MKDQKVIVYVFTADLARVVVLKERLRRGAPLKFSFVKGTHEPDRDGDIRSTVMRELSEEVGLVADDINQLVGIPIEENLYEEPPPARYHFFRAVVSEEWNERADEASPMDDEFIEEVLTLQVEEVLAKNSSDFHVPVIHEVFATQGLPLP